MAKSLGPDARTTRTTACQLGSSASPERHTPARAGQIGPVRREIIFEPVHEQPTRREPAPVEPPPVAPETQPREPVPARS